MSTREPEYKIQVGEYEKNRSYKVPAGTKFVSVMKGFHFDSNPEKHAADAVAMAFREANRRFGQFDHEDCDYALFFATCQVVVELRIRPKEKW